MEAYQSPKQKAVGEGGFLFKTIGNGRYKKLENVKGGRTAEAVRYEYEKALNFKSDLKQRLITLSDNVLKVYPGIVAKMCTPDKKNINIIKNKKNLSKALCFVYNKEN